MCMIERWSFDNDELFDLVVSGQKCGTCCLYNVGDKIESVGDIEIIYNSHGKEQKIEITAVKIARFCDVDDDWARSEGEGDLSLEYWRRVHLAFFRNIKPDFAETDMLCLTSFTKR